MSNFLNNIKLIASDLANMSPKTQLEIVKLCKNLCLNVKDYLVELDETTLNNINVAIENLQIAVNNIENELDTAEENITAIQNAIDTLASITYTKTETNALLDGKVDKSNVGFVELSAETSTGTLTDAQYNETLKRFCIIKFGVGELFYKARNQWFTKLDYTLTEMTNYSSIKYDNIIVNNDKTWYRSESRTIQFYNTSQINTFLNNKQNTLISGINIKTINNESILGNGNINISGDTALYEHKVLLETNNDNKFILLTKYSNSSAEIVNMSDIDDTFNSNGILMDENDNIYPFAFDGSILYGYIIVNNVITYITIDKTNLSINNDTVRQII